MIEFKGKYATAKVFADSIEESCVEQIHSFLNNKAFKGLKIRIMPDVHTGKGAVVGFTSTIEDKVIPNVVGVDIGCGILTVEIKERKIDFKKLDNMIKSHIPSGSSIRDKEHAYTRKLRLDDLRCLEYIDIKRAMLSCATLGSGNHFIEINKGSSENLYISIHTGSRHLGKQVAEYYQNLACERLKDEEELNRDLAYLTGEDMEDYIHDMQVVQEYANTNREAIADTIIKQMGFRKVKSFHTIHNYIDLDEKILRKGAISAQEGEKVAIPISMKDGVILGVGKGNEDWNCSACHGAGRVLSRSKARKTVSLKDFKVSMKGVFTTCVNINTIDESPFVYKNIEDILPFLEETIDILDIAKPVYNYKSSK